MMLGFLRGDRNTIRVSIRQGKRGRWRYYCYAGEKYLFGSGIRGFATHDEAERAAREALSARVVIERVS